MIHSSKALSVWEAAQGRHRIRNYRGRILASFRALGHGVDARTARMRMHEFYRSSGTEWARALS